MHRVYLNVVLMGLLTGMGVGEGVGVFVMGRVHRARGLLLLLLLGRWVGRRDAAESAVKDSEVTQLLALESIALLGDRDE